MGAKTSIEWTDATWNPIGGCAIKSPGCTNCYAQSLAGTRLARHPLYAGTTDTVKGKHVFNGKLTAAADDHPVWTWPLKWRGAKEPILGPNKPSLIFVGDMSDLFHEDRPAADIDRVMAVAALSPHVMQLLTKRSDRMRSHSSYEHTPNRVADQMFSVGEAIGINMREKHPELYHPQHGFATAPPRWPLPNVWLGFSAERQQEFDERWPAMRDLAAKGWTIFVSIEPMIGPVVLPEDFLAIGSRAQVIVGGESGPNARPMHPDWPRALRDQCQAAGVPFLFKQWGSWAPHRPAAGGDLGGDIRSGTVRIVHPGAETNARVSQETGGRSTLPGSRYMINVGKKAAGRLLDGRIWNEYPEARS